MGKIRLFILALILLFTLGTGVSAASSVTGAQSSVAVASDGSCQVSLTITLHLEQVEDSILFPVPLEATGVTLNGNRVSASKDGTVRNIDLSDVIGEVVGDFSFHIQYGLHDVVHDTETGGQQLELPLLCGFGYTIESLQLTVTLPGKVEAKPAFTSGYHQSSIEADLDFHYEGMQITCTSLKPLKDHETLTMLLQVSDDLFPRSIVANQTPTTAAIAMGICGALALIYWLLTLRHLPWRRIATTEVPEGVDPGTAGCALGLQGMQLSMTVLNWAQLGYVHIIRNRKGSVTLCKHMDMGNERTENERRCFQALFGKRDQINTASATYARLHKSLAEKPARVRELFTKGSGSLKIFRILATGIGMFGGAGIGLMMGSGAALQGFLVFLFGLLGTISGYIMIPWAGSLGLHRHGNLTLGLGLAGLWLLLGLLGGVFYLGFWMVFGLLLAGILHRIGGRRTDLGHHTAQQLRGLRYHLRNVSTATVRQRTEIDPDYFFRLYPAALALGVEKQFAKAFGGLRLGACPYLSGAGNDTMTANQWCALLGRVVDSMEDRASKLTLEKLLKKLRSLIGK